jgi:hypothetical protein
MNKPNLERTLEGFAGTVVYRSEEDIKVDRRISAPPSVGDKILCPVPGGWARAVVQSDNYGKLYATSDKLIWTLDWCFDQRACWVAYPASNKEGIEKLKLKESEMDP